MFGVYQTSVPRRWGIAGFSLTNIPDGGVEIIDTTDMQNEPLLAQGDASTNIPENTAYICVISHSIIAYNILD